MLKMLRESLKRIKQDTRLLVVIIVLVIISSVILYNTLFYVSPTRVYPQIDEISYTLSGGARPVAGMEGKWTFEALAEDFNSYTLDITVKIYDFQGNTKYVNVWFRYSCDPNVYPCKGEQLSDWSGYAPEGEPPPAIVHGINADREWLWWQSSVAGGEQAVVVEASLTIWYLGEPSSTQADNLDYYLLDITPEDTEGNKASWQYRIDNTWIDKPADWVDQPEWEEELEDYGIDIGEAPSFEFFSILILIPIILYKRRKKDE